MKEILPGYTWRGIDRASDKLVVDPSTHSIMGNVMFTDGSWRARRGIALSSLQVPSVQAPFLGLHGYSYYDQDTGATLEELVELVWYNNYLEISPLSHDGAYVSLSHATTSGYTISILPETTGWVVTLKLNGTDVAGWPRTYGDGIGPGATGTALQTLQTDLAIEGITLSDSIGISANWPIVSELGVVEETAVAVAPATTVIYRYAGLGSLAPDYVGSPSSQPTPLETPDYIYPAFLNAYDSCYVAAGGPLYKYDGVRFYRAGIRKPVEHYVQLAAGGSLAIGSYLLAFRFVHYDNRGRANAGPLYYQEITTTSGNQTINFGFGNPNFEGQYGTINASVGPTNTIDVDLAMVDLEAELEVGDIIIVLDSGGWVYKTITAITSPAKNRRSITFIGNVTVTAGNQVFGSKSWNFPCWGHTVGASQANVGSVGTPLSLPYNTTIGQLQYTDNFAQAGDTLFFGREGTRKVVSATDTGSAVNYVLDKTVSVVAGDQVSINTRLEVFISEVGGLDVYLQDEIPVGPSLFVTGGINGTVPLGPLLSPPRRQPDPPPRCTLICEHDGLIVLAGDPDNPNTIYFNDPSNPEGFSRKSNFFDIPSTVKGRITAIFSENGILSVCKRNSFYPVHGDIFTGGIKIGAKSENRLGVESHKSVVNVDDYIMAMGPTGPVEIRNGIISDVVSTAIRPDFRKQEYKQQVDVAISAENELKKVLKYSTAVLDDAHDIVIFFVPCESGTLEKLATATTAISPNENSRVYVYNLGNEEWSEFTVPVLMNMGLGFTMYNGTLHWMSRPITHAGYWKNGIFRFSNYNSEYDFQDNIDSIVLNLRSNFDHGGQPSQHKYWQKYEMYRLNSDPSNRFEVDINAYMNWDTSTAIMNHTQSFLGDDDIIKIGKFPPQKMLSLAMEWVIEAWRVQPIISGVDWLINRYNLEDLKR